MAGALDQQLPDARLAVAGPPPSNPEPPIVFPRLAVVPTEADKTRPLISHPALRLMPASTRLENGTSARRDAAPDTMNPSSVT